MENLSNRRRVQEDVIHLLETRSRMRDGWRPRLSIAAIVFSTSTLDVSHRHQTAHRLSSRILLQ